METKKLVRSVKIIADLDSFYFEVGKDDVVSIEQDAWGVAIHFRGEDEKSENSTPRKMQDRAMKYFHGYPFIIEDVLS